MGKLVDGTWHDVWYDTAKTGGRFVRKSAGFRHWITADGAAGVSGEAGFAAEAGRYHLYVSYACPWAHRTLIFRALKGLESMIDVSVVHPFMDKHGWTFDAGEGVVADTVHASAYLHELYTRADPHYTGRVTVPVLWDKKTDTIVSNESSEIIRMMNSAFDDLGAQAGDYYPAALRGAIDAVNARVYANVNNGVYKCGFATTQAAYNDAFDALFDTLDWLEARLEGQAYLVENTLTEADIRLYTTLVRFDMVYVQHFKTNKARIRDYPNLHAYLKRLHALPGVAGTLNVDHIKTHYFTSHPSINPHRIIPRGPETPF